MAPQRGAERGVRTPVVRVSGSWFLLTGLIVVGYGGYLHQRLPWLGARAYLAALAFAVLLGLSVLVHELAHAGAARAFGWQVREIRLTLMGGHTTFDAAREAPGRSALVSLAGPAANLVLALLGAILLGSLDPGGLPRLVVELVTTANLLVGAFNLLPGLPLDGGHAVAALIWRISGSRRAGVRTAAVLGGLVAAALVLRLLLPGRAAGVTELVITVLLAVFLLDGARRAVLAQRTRDRLAPLRAGDLARPLRVLDPRDPVSRALRLQEGVPPDGAPAPVLVVAAGPEALGVVDAQALGRVAEAGAVSTPVEAVLRRAPFGPAVAADLAGEELVRTAQALPGGWWPVTGLPAPAILAEEDVRRAVTGALAAGSRSRGA
ncbi:site-2 protease family protein [Rothia kristinae]|uniref:site-2 protease family protein n=1 Tax=Rothia kristinae TaxID=37923 RepID=UPI0034151FD9